MTLEQCNAMLIWPHHTCLLVNIFLLLIALLNSILCSFLYECVLIINGEHSFVFLSAWIIIMIRFIKNNVLSWPQKFQTPCHFTKCRRESKDQVFSKRACLWRLSLNSDNRRRVTQHRDRVTQHISSISRPSWQTLGLTIAGTDAGWAGIRRKLWELPPTITWTKKTKSGDGNWMLAGDWR